MNMSYEDFFFEIKNFLKLAKYSDAEHRGIISIKLKFKAQKSLSKLKGFQIFINYTSLNYKEAICFVKPDFKFAALLS